MFNLSSETADATFNIANVVLIFGAVLVAGATGVSIWSAGIRERYADQRIEKNEVITQQAIATAATANATAAIAGQRTAELQKESDELRLKWEEEQTQRRRIEAGLASRHVSAEQAEILKEDLARYSGISIHIDGYSDAEADAFATELTSALEAAGAKVDFDRDFPVINPPPVGLIVSFTRSDTAQSALFETLTRAGFDTTDSGSSRPGQASIMVGLKRAAF